ncbi:MAG: hypothetical protein M1461_13025 [Nitrospirae bacterium]|nr:hypothetical protein [Nitrospirota bacterium]
MTSDADSNLEGVPPEEIFSYLEMQAHCGFFGFSFTLVWFFLAHRLRFINLLSFTDTDLLLLLVILLFFGAPIYPLGWWARRKFNKNEINAARNFLRLCSVSCIVSFTLLMWVTGGAGSPFVSLFVMTFTLTLSKVKTPKGPQVILLIFLCSFLISSFFAKSHPFFSDDTLKELSHSNLNYFALLVGGIFSFIIPTGSTLYLKHKAAKQK